MGVFFRFFFEGVDWIQFKISFFLGVCVCVCVYFFFDWFMNYIIKRVVISNELIEFDLTVTTAVEYFTKRQENHLIILLIIILIILSFVYWLNWIKMQQPGEEYFTKRQENHLIILLLNIINYLILFYHLFHIILNLYIILFTLSLNIINYLNYFI